IHDAETLARLDALRQLTTALASACAHNDTLAYEAADDYLRAVGLALLGWAFARLAHAGADAPRWRAPLAAARLRLLPEFELRQRILQNQCGAPARTASA